VQSRSNRIVSRLLLSAACTAFAATGTATDAQTSASQSSSAPLSVIDWLGTQTAPTLLIQKKNRQAVEPAITRNGLPPQVAVAPLGIGKPRQIGLVPANVTGLPTSLWQGSNVTKITALLDRLPELEMPAAQALLYTLLLAEVDAPGGISAAGDTLALARVKKLVKLGALDPALSLIEQSGVPTSAAHFDLWMQISLLTGTEDRACGVLRGSPHLTKDLSTRIFCAARDGKWENAALTFGSAQALGLLPPEKLALIDRFLHPDAFEGSPLLPAPRVMDPLSFRLFETIGEAFPTRMLPRAYAVADLRDLAGWKSQIEAAERLTRAGALPDNRLLGLYTERQAAASGGVWDRVAAVQRFETALTTRNSEAVGKTLPGAWRAMQDAGLEIAFSSLFYEDLVPIELSGRASVIATNVALLSADYEQTAAKAKLSSLATQIATGQVTGHRPNDPIRAALFDAFIDAKPRADLVAMAQQSRLGEGILHILRLMHDGAQGDANAMRDALATLRALGLEDIARRAALQTIVLDR
jgi:hypothetical protein